MQSIVLQHGIEFKVWEEIRLVVGEKADAGVYRARIEDFRNGKIVITSPEFAFGHTRLRRNVQVVVQFTRQDAVYQFRSRITVRTTKGKRQNLLDPPSKIERIQRRAFVRVEMILKVQYAELPDEPDWERLQDLSWHKTSIADISAGGVLMGLESPLSEGTVLILKINLPDETGFPGAVLAEVRRTFTREEHHFGGLLFILRRDFRRFFFSAQSSRIPDVLKSFNCKAQDKLANFLFHQEIEQRKRGLL